MVFAFALIGLLSVMAAPLLRIPLVAWMDASRRADLGVGAPACPAACTAPGGNDMLEAACSESCFTILGPLLGDAPVPGSDWVVVNPLGSAVPGANPYFGGSAAVAGGIKTRMLGPAAVPGGTRVQMAAHTLPATAASRVRRHAVGWSRSGCAWHSSPLTPVCPRAVLLQVGASAKLVTSRYDGTALIAAADLGRDGVGRQLIKAGAPIDHVNNLH
jgi:hypothetical protein